MKTIGSTTFAIAFADCASVPLITVARNNAMPVATNMHPVYFSVNFIFKDIFFIRTPPMDILKQYVVKFFLNKKFLLCFSALYFSLICPILKSKYISKKRFLKQFERRKYL